MCECLGEGEVDSGSVSEWERVRVLMPSCLSFLGEICLGGDA